LATIVTHAVVASALAPLAPRGVPISRLMLAVCVLAVLPDLDVVSFALGIPYAHPLGHRGFSHSLSFAFAAAVLVARFKFHSWRVLPLLFAAITSHGVLDALTDGGRGVGFLIPFSNERFFAPVRPLPVSPIGLHRSVLPVLAAEVVCVWVPTLAFAAGAFLARRTRTA
jgi:inner membrane protein